MYYNSSTTCNHWSISPVTFISSGNGRPCGNNACLGYICLLFHTCVLTDEPDYLTGDRNCHSVSLSCTQQHKRCQSSIRGREFVGSLGSRQNVFSWEQCGKICKAFALCNFWAYDTSGTNKCYLWQTCDLAMGKTAPGFIVGNRDCPKQSKK